MFICFECFSAAAAAAWCSLSHLSSALMRVKVDVWRSHFRVFNFLASSATLSHSKLRLYLHVSTNVRTWGMFSDAIASDHYLRALWLCLGCKTRLSANYSLSDGLALSPGASFWSKYTQNRYTPSQHHHAFVTAITVNKLASFTWRIRDRNVECIHFCSAGSTRPAQGSFLQPS